MIRTSITGEIEDIGAPFLAETKAAIKDEYLKVVNYATEPKGKKGASMQQTIIYVGLDFDDLHVLINSVFSLVPVSKPIECFYRNGFIAFQGCRYQ